MSLSPGEISVEHLRIRVFLETLPDDASDHVVSMLVRALAKNRESYTVPLLRACENTPHVRDIDRRLLESTARSVDHLARRLTDCRCTGDARTAIALALRDLLHEQERLERELLSVTAAERGAASTADASTTSPAAPKPPIPIRTRRQAAPALTREQPGMRQG